MGDAGSTVLGYIFATVPLIALVESRWAVRSPLRQGFGGQTARGGSTDTLLIAAALVVWPFLADGTFTILRRLKNREKPPAGDVSIWSAGGRRCGARLARGIR